MSEQEAKSIVRDIYPFGDIKPCPGNPNMMGMWLFEHSFQGSSDVVYVDDEGRVVEI